MEYLESQILETIVAKPNLKIQPVRVRFYCFLEMKVELFVPKRINFICDEGKILEKIFIL